MYNHIDCYKIENIICYILMPKIDYKAFLGGTNKFPAINPTANATATSNAEKAVCIPSNV